MSLPIALGLLFACTDDPTGIPPIPPGQQAEWEFTALSGTTGLEPGQELIVDFDLSGHSPFDAVLWVDPGTEEEAAGGPLMHPTPSATVWEGFTRTAIALPILAPGTHTLAVGDTLGPRSDRITVEVVVAPRRLSQEAVAQTIEAGLWGLADGTRGIFEARDVRGTPLFSSLGAQLLGGLDVWLNGVAELGRLAADEYRAIEPAQEQQFQAYLRNSGILAVLEGFAATPPTPAAIQLAGLVLDETPHAPHLVFYVADAMEAMLSAAGPLLDAATIVSLIFGGPVAAVPGLLSVAIDIERTVIRTFVPTEIGGIDAHHQNVVIDCVPFTEAWWAELHPQAKGYKGVLDFASDAAVRVVLARLSPGVPRSARDQLAKLGEKMLSKLGLSFALSATPLRYDETQDGYSWTTKVVVNPKLYAMTVGDFVGLAGEINPILAPVTIPFSWAMKVLTAAGVIPGEPPSSVDIEYPSGPPGSGGRVLGKDYPTDRFSVPWIKAETFTPNGIPIAEEYSAVISLSAWHWGSKDLGGWIGRWARLYSIPWPQMAEPATHAVTVVGEGLDCALETTKQIKRDSAQSIILTTRNPVIDAPVDWVRAGDAVSYGFPIARVVFRDLLHTACEAEHWTTWEVKVDGRRLFLQTGVLTDPQWLGALSPGPNTVEVTATGNTSCFREGRLTWGVNTVLEFPDALNSGSGRRIHVRAQGLVATETFTLWVPPAHDGS